MKTPGTPPSNDTPRTLPLPGMAAIAFYLLMLAIWGVVGALTGRHPAATKISILILSTCFAIAGLGLIRKRRWGWALALGAVVLSFTFALYSFMHLRQGQWFVMTAANFVFFLYLIRPEVVQNVK